MSDLSKYSLLVYTPFERGEIAQSLGNPEYSYYFVMRAFLPVLEDIAPTSVVTNLETLDAACLEIRQAGREPLMLCFVPPHRLPAATPCRALPVFAWEFDTLPNENWDGTGRHDWISILQKCPGAIVHSGHTARVTRKAVGPAFPVLDVPAPVWDRFATLQAGGWTGEERVITFDGTLLDSTELGLGEEPQFDELPFTSKRHNLTLGGVVYTSVLNPEDGRKNWYDQITAFVWAFRDDPNATLVFKLVHHNRDRCCAALLLEMRKLAPYACKIIVIHGYLDEEAYSQLVMSTTFVVNSSTGEGQCLPLMEFMSAGRPAIAPNHTAMSDYVDETNAFLVRSSTEWASWPQDPRMMFRCKRHRIDWDSLREAFRASAKIARERRDVYRRMSSQASQSLSRRCSARRVRRDLAQFLTEIREC